MTSQPSAGPGLPARIAIVVNPTKVDDLSSLRSRLAQVCGERGIDEPSWHETSEQDPGEGAARGALETGADLICSLGGDGTVRAVASALGGTGVPLGLLPGGTGNLLARNLGLNLESIETAFAEALDGVDRAIDLAHVRLEPSDDNLDFVVMAGVGFDAQVMADTDDTLKKHVGWAAYLVAGARNLWGSRFGVSVEASGTPCHHQHARSVVVGNCGALQGGIALMPDARLDDGQLDAVVLAPHGVSGWASVAIDVVTRHQRGHRRLIRLAGDEIHVHTDVPMTTQVDGDVVGTSTDLRLSVTPGALLVRVPESELPPPGRPIRPEPEDVAQETEERGEDMDERDPHVLGEHG